MAPWMDYIKDRLEKYPELAATRLYDEIKKKGYNGSLRTVRREVAKIKPPALVRMFTPQKTLPGEQAQADWGHFGKGVPQVILFDNAKTVVAERVGTIVRFNAGLMNFALHAGFFPKACWVGDPESKGKVESGVKYVRKGFFYGLEWKDLDDLNAKVRDWRDNTANSRVHGTTREIPWERLREEMSYLKKLPQSLPTWIMETRTATKRPPNIDRC